jgi:hypothetical protein
MLAEVYKPELVPDARCLIPLEKFCLLLISLLAPEHN